MRRFAILVVMPLLAACASTHREQSSGGAFTPSFQPPPEYETDRVRLEPLAPDHAELDYVAVMGSREHLRRTLHWGSWPGDDMTVEQNRKDLQRHIDEFEAHEAYAYTVLSPDGSECLGCVYITPAEGDPRAASLAYWVIEPELTTDLDRHLVSSVLDLMESDFPIDRVEIEVHNEDSRGSMILTDLDLIEEPSTSPDHRRYVWRRSA